MVCILLINSNQYFLLLKEIPDDPFLTTSIDIIPNNKPNLEKLVISPSISDNTNILPTIINGKLIFNILFLTRDKTCTIFSFIIFPVGLFILILMKMIEF